ncbi:MAG: DCC1-like thiol-disulfide oxidoreductase family protein [Draconibacterium sp.]|nr:DCC1-like thiol-disulfide oxidoreductase family protein [Draconibacterium sp.]
MPKENQILLFDGVCNLCNGAVDFIQKRDKKKLFRFVALQSEKGKMLVGKLEISHELDSIILISGDQVFIESDAAIEIARLLPAPWNWFSAFKIIPLKSRNKMYQWIAENRYRWFGKRKICRIV